MTKIQGTDYPKEWWHCKDGEQTYWSEREMAGIRRRMEKRSNVLTDEHVGHGRPGMTVLKACPDCGMMWAPQFGAKRCSKCRAKHASQASANARRGKAVAR